MQRWLRPQCQDGDHRQAGKRAYSCPPNKLSAEERQAALEMRNSDEFKDLPPSQIVPRLAAPGQSVAPESPPYRFLPGAGPVGLPPTRHAGGAAMRGGGHDGGGVGGG